MFTVWLIFAGGFSKDFLWVMEHFLIATTMVVISLFSVLCWDSIFPDKRDVLVLAPLPIRANTLFRAKLAALIAALSLSVVSLNIFSGLVWPFLFSATNGGGFFGMTRSLAAYWTTMALAGLFMFCCVLGVQGVTSLVLPRQQFLRLSALLQAGAFFVFFGGYILEPSLETAKALTAPENQRLLACLPSYWFLGLFQQLNGSMIPAFAPLARRAWLSLAETGMAESCGRGLRRCGVGGAGLLSNNGKDRGGAEYCARGSSDELVSAVWIPARNVRGVVQYPHLAAQPPASGLALLLSWYWVRDRACVCEDSSWTAGISAWTARRCGGSCVSGSESVGHLFCRDRRSHGDSHATYTAGELDLSHD